MNAPPQKPDVSEQPLFAGFPSVSTEAWEHKIQDDLGSGRDLRSLDWHLPGGPTLRPFYRADDLDDLPHLDALDGRMSAGPPRLRQDVVAPDLREANCRAREALEGGATDLGFALSSPGGLHIDSAADMQALLADLPLAETPLHVTGGRFSSSQAALAYWLEEAERQGIAAAKLRGSVALDPCGTLVRTGAVPADAFDQLARAVKEANAPHLRLLAADATPFHEAGASLVQESALLLASVSEHLAQGTEHGLAPEHLVERLHLVVPVGTRYFPEIARLRALRLLFAQVAGAFTEEEAPPAFIQAAFSRHTQTRYDAPTNLLRSTTEAAAALLGGCDVLAVHPFDLLRPNAFTHRMARNVPLLLRHEAHLDHVTDPAAGSYYLEVLTDKMARAAWALFQEFEAEGGLLAALESGFVQKKIAAHRAQQQEDVATRRRVLVGTNHYPPPDEERLDDVEATPEANPGDADDQTKSGGLPAPITAAPLPARRLAEPFEALRLRTERFARRQGRTPTVFLLPFDRPAVRSARANFARNLFGCAGFRVEEPPGFDDAEEAAAAAARSEAALVVLCSTDDAYASLAPVVRQRLQQMGAPPLLVAAGRPGAHESALREAGVDGFIHRGQNALTVLAFYQEKIGIIS